MKVTKEVVQLFEDDQKAYGTKTAIWNLLWLNASEQFRDLGITSIRTTEKKRTKRGQGRKNKR